MKRNLSLFFVLILTLSIVLSVNVSAVRNQIPADIEGAVDLNNDGVCSLEDVEMILNHIVHKEILSGDTLKKADINGDGTVDVTDATALRKVILYAYIPVTSIVLNTYSVTLHREDTVQLTASVIPNIADDPYLTYTSADSEIAEVDSTGLITAVSLGSTEITVSATNGVSEICTVNVVERPVSEIKLNTESVFLNRNESVQLDVEITPANADNQTLTYKIDNTSVAQVDKNGVITGKDWGTATVTVTAASGASATCLVSVYDIIDKNLKFTDDYDLREGEPKGVILHHAAGNGSVEVIHGGHLYNGWAGIGYHFYVRKDGTVYRGRPEEWMGAHAGGYNDYIGICSEGNFMNETMSKAQKDSVVKVLKYLYSKYGLMEVYKHRDFNATGCPGTYFPFDEVVHESTKGLTELKLASMMNALQEILPSPPIPSFSNLR